MNTTEVAAHLGTTPRTLRQFLRSNSSTFVAVGSGSRYEFDTGELPTLEKRFREWSGQGTATRKRPKAAVPVQRRSPDTRASRDAEVWAAEEGQIVLEDIRKPEVRAAVRAEARRQEDHLNLLLMRAGLHISQSGWDGQRKRG
jgi:hypothetical protein